MLKLKHLINSVLITIFINLMNISGVYAVDCSAVFPSGLATFNNRTAYVDANASVINQTSSALTSVFVSSGSGATCNGVSCTATGTNSGTLAAPVFSNPQTAIPANGKLSGDYHITGSLSLTQPNLRIEGPTRIYVTGALSITASIGNNIDPGDLFIYVEGSVVVYTNFLRAYIYANGYVDLIENGTFSGAFTGGADAILRHDSVLTYQSPISSNLTDLCTPASSSQCDAYFPDTLQGNSVSSNLILRNSAQVIGDADNTLTFPTLSDTTVGNHDSCDTVDCSVSTTVAPALTLPAFLTTSVTTDVTETSGSATIGSGGDHDVSEIDVLTINGSANVTFLASATPYKIKSGFFSGTGTPKVTFNAGEYWFDFLEVLDNVEIIVNGPVTIFVNQHFNIEDTSKVNIAGAAKDLVFVSYAQLNLKNSVEIKAVIYGVGSEVELQTDVDFTGVISSGNKLELNGNTTVTYEDVSGLQVGSICGGAPVLAPFVNYRFDACSWDGTTSEVIDQMGNQHATSKGGVSTGDIGKIERFADLQGYDDHIETTVVLPASWSVSTWFKVPTDTTGSINFVLGAMAAGGDLLYLDRSTNWTWGIYDGSSSTDGTFSFATLDSNWHHLTLVYDNNQSQLYIDGSYVETINRAPGGTLKYIGTSFDDVNTIDAQGFRAPLDEFMVFKQALSSSEISDIYSNQNQQKNYDATSRAAVSCLPTPVAHYEMDEASWGAVIDSESGFNGVAYNGADTIGSACRYGAFDGVDDYVEIPHDALLNGSDALTYVAFIRPDSWTGIDQIMAKSVHGGGSGRAQMGVFSEAGVFKVRAETNAGRKEITAPLPTPAGNWVHVAAVFNGNSLNLYLDGTLVVSSSFTATTLVQTTDPLNISKRVGTNQYYFDGLIDDVRVYTQALTAQQVSDLYTTLTPCTLSTVDHYRLEITDISGLTCEAKSMTLKACLDANCNSNSTASTTVNLSPSPGVTTSWSPGESFSFTGQQALTFSSTTTSTITYGLDSATPSASLRCFIGGSEVSNLSDCKTNFDDTGFRFANDAAVTPVLPVQLSGKPSDTGFNAQSIYLQAVKTDDNTGACTGVFPNGGDIAVELSYTCHPDSTSCTNNLVLRNNANDLGLTQAYAAHNLRFNTDSKAYFSVNYPDAGKVFVNAKKDITVGGLTKNIAKSSNNFIVRPFGFKLDFSQDANSTDALAANATGTKFKKTGESFNLRATAVQWVNGEDTDNNGIPDDFSLLSDNAIAGYFNNEGINVTPRLLQPVSGTNGTLTAQTSNNFVSSIADNTYNYSEVGIIGLDAVLTDGDYLTGGNIQGKIENVGRFVPDHFKLTSSTVTEACAGFTYMGQELNVQYTLQAQNSANVKTANYMYDGVDATKNFAKAGSAYFIENDMVSDHVKASEFIKTSDSSTRLSMPMQNWLNGEINYDQQVKLLRNDTVDGPYTDIDLMIKLTDPDSSVLQNLDQDPEVLGTGSPSNSKKLNSTPLEFRYGRLAMQNTYGSAFNKMQLPLRLEYWDGNEFRLNQLDNCSTYSLNISQVSPVSPVLTFNINGTNPYTFALGAYKNTEGIFVESLSTELQGVFTLEYTATPDWLKFDWQGDNSQLNPQGIVQFGRYRGNDRVIFWKEQ